MSHEDKVLVAGEIGAAAGTCRAPVDVEERGTLKPGEYHPGADIAMTYIRAFLAKHDGGMTLEALSSVGLSGCRSSEICAETLRRVLFQEAVSDRYLMGLAWFLFTLDAPQT